MPLEVLNLALVLLCFLQVGEGPEVAALAGGGVFLARIQAVLAGFEFAYHGKPRTWGRRRKDKTRLSPQGFSGIHSTGKLLPKLLGSEKEGNSRRYPGIRMI